MFIAEPYPTPSPSPTSGILNDVTSSLSGLVPAGAVDSGIAAVFAVTTVLLAALGFNHSRRGTWLNGWLSGPSALLTSFIAAVYGASGLPNLLGKGGFDPAYPDMQSLAVSVVVAASTATLVAGAAWPVAAHISTFRGSPSTFKDLREWVLVDRLPAAGGATAGGALAWIVVTPVLCLAGAVIGVLSTVTVVTLRAAPVARTAPTPPPRVAHPQPQAVPPPVSAPTRPAVSDENW